MLKLPRFRKFYAQLIALIIMKRKSKSWYAPLVGFVTGEGLLRDVGR